ncbi:hypothetical protein BJV78DRAFT_1364803 [Lactifluus subvellereus]|nr:hypothetical protein BJV78DRAFT_1364803 [Lactifluus subvellereus]
MVLGDTDQIPDIAWALSVAQEANPTVPLFHMDHSMANTQNSVSQLSGIIATSPCLCLAKPLASIVCWLGSRVHAILPNQNIPASIEPKYLSHDPAVVKENEMDTRHSMSLHAVNDMLTRGENLVTKDYKRWPTSLPVLIVPGMEDMSSFTTSSPGLPNTHTGLCILDPGKQTFHIMRMIAVALIVTFGIKVSVGIFILTLGVGACAGHIVGLVVQYARWRWPTVPVFASCPEDSPCVIPGLYAMILSRIMLAVLVAKTVADTLEPKGIYDLVIKCTTLGILPQSSVLMKIQAFSAPIPQRIVF